MCFFRRVSEPLNKYSTKCEFLKFPNLPNGWHINNGDSDDKRRVLLGLQHLWTDGSDPSPEIVRKSGITGHAKVERLIGGTDSIYFWPFVKGYVREYPREIWPLYGTVPPF